ncbi:hypothetical protein TanjilG_15621 [Lupinus angustifolius]|uniref:homeobox protein 13 n=1 Tax=Lupinus angustifolius TaxID=3871 RepID=UPI00090E6323|nr:PREDICTED: homeobox protein 13 [Lupinus angustifolius]OIV90888.1 hypothetical protein TanjilG_15621 [Lupinus angustifolius]
MELLQKPTNNVEHQPSLTPHFFQDFDSTCSTPYVSAPSSPGRGPPMPGFFYSAPASPMHFSITSSYSSSYQNCNNNNASSSSDFEFSARFGLTGSGGSGSMSSADELFLNGQIRPMKLSTHLERPQVLAPLLDLEEEDEEDDEDRENEIVVVRGRDLRLRDKSVRRRTRSMSPLRNNTHLEWSEKEDDHAENNNNNNNNNIKNSNDSTENEKEKVEEDVEERTTPCVSASSSRSSSAGRSSKRWVFLKDFLRSKSEGRSNNKFWSTISFSPNTKEKKTNHQNLHNTPVSKEGIQKPKGSGKKITGKPMNGVGKRPSLHELHYKANRAQAEELRKKTFLPYRQGLLGCLGFSSKGYGAMNGLARALNPVSSR